MRVAFIGAGNIASAHLAALRRVGADVVGVCTRGETGPTFAGEHGIEHVGTDPGGLVADCAPDAVFVLTPAAQYPEVLASLKPHGLPLFLEKPIAYTVAAAEALRPLLPPTVFVGLNRRFYGNVQAIRPLLAQHERFSAFVAVPEREKDYAPRDAGQRDAWPMINGIHCVDLIRYLCGDCTEVVGVTQWGELEHSTAARYASGVYRTGSGNVVTFVSNLDSPGGWRINIFLPKAEVILAPIERTVVKTMTGPEEIPLAADDTDAKLGFVAQARCFLDGVRSPEALPDEWVSFDDALASMRLVEFLFCGGGGG